MEFDITREPWLPVRSVQGETRELNLLDFLEQSPELKGLDGLNPMEEYSVHRFLAVFLLAVLKPKVWEDKLDLLEKGRFDMERIHDYIRQCQEEGVSFDLFDAKRPFLQSPYDEKYDQEKNLKSPAILDSTRASGNNPIHFDHNLEEEVCMSPVQAFHGLMASQIFCTAMSGGYPSNVYGAPPMFYLPLGENLFQRLVLSIPRMSAGEDSAKEFWREKMEVVPKKDVAMTSRLYGMFFPARRIRLVEEDGIVTKVYYQPGLHFTGFSSWSDPHVAYRRNKEQAMVSIKPSLDREGWRNLGTIAMQFAKERDGVPEVLRDYAKILEELELTQMDILSLGAVTNQASYCDMQRGMMQMDVRIAKDVEKCLWVGEAVGFAEDVGYILRKCLKQMIAAEKNSRGEGDVQRAVHVYFSDGEKLFYDAEREIAACEDSSALPDKMKEWQEKVGKTARKIFQRMQNIYCNTAEELFRAEEAYKWMNIGMAKRKEGK